MLVNLIRIHSIPAKIDISSVSARIGAHSVPSKLDIEKIPSKLEIHQKIFRFRLTAPSALQRKGIKRYLCSSRKMQRKECRH